MNILIKKERGTNNGKQNNNIQKISRIIKGL